MERLKANQILNCDCLDLMDEIVRGGVELPNGEIKNKIDLIICDPPYLIDYKTNHRKDKNHRFCKTIENDNNPQLIIDIMPKLYECLKDNGAMYMFCGSDHIDFFVGEVKKYFTIKNLIVWDKGNWTAGDLEAQYGKQYEFVIYANKGRAKFEEGSYRYTDIWKFSRVSGNSQIHQNEKPTDLLSRMIKQHSKEGDLVMDIFSGSGATAVASRKLNRYYIASELDKEYYDKSIERINNGFAQQSFLWK